MTKRKTVRKPRDLYCIDDEGFQFRLAHIVGDSPGVVMTVGSRLALDKSLRDLSAWLLRAADYLEYKARKK